MKRSVLIKALLLTLLTVGGGLAAVAGIAGSRPSAADGTVVSEIAGPGRSGLVGADTSSAQQLSPGVTLGAPSNTVPPSTGERLERSASRLFSLIDRDDDGHEGEDD